MLQVGDRFPVERLTPVPDGPTIVYFYPAALTPGCTTEAKAFNDRYEQFREAGYEVIGVSIDPSDRNDEFRTECALNFPLVSDEEGRLTGELDLLKDYGEYGILARRVTFELDADGIVRNVWEVTDERAHPQEVLAAVSA